jgi:pimeloyl-ACP methyl ester carboxylesterase
MLLPASTENSLLTLSDGRQLGYTRYGVENGTPLLYLHGLPGSRLEGQLIDQPARLLDISIIAVDRPGYGTTTPLSGKSLLEWTADIEQLTTYLGWQQFGIIGFSGGGPCALACAHELAGRVTGVALVAGLGPVYEQHLLREMGNLARLAFFLARHVPVSLGFIAGKPLTLLARHQPQLLINALAAFNGEPDKHCLQNEVVFNAVLRSLPACFAQGAEGALHDLILFQHPWKVPFSGITVPVHLWHGNRDNVVPLKHSEYLAGQLGNARLNCVKGEGHFSLPLRHMQRLLSDFIATL